MNLSAETLYNQLKNNEEFKNITNFPDKELIIKLLEKIIENSKDMIELVLLLGKWKSI